MMRDARLNQIGEGANDVLRAFIVVYGLKPVADQLMKVKDALARPITRLGTLLSFGGKQLWARVTTPDVPVRSAELRAAAKDLGARVRDFSLAVQAMAIKHQIQLPFRQYVLERLADAACELYASSCTLARLDALLGPGGNGNAAEVERDATAGLYFLKLSDRRVRQCLAGLSDNDDKWTTRAADAVLGRY
jgi:hypothetical protein